MKKKKQHTHTHREYHQKPQTPTYWNRRDTSPNRNQKLWRVPTVHPYTYIYIYTNLEYNDILKLGIAEIAEGYLSTIFWLSCKYYYHNEKNNSKYYQEQASLQKIKT